MNFLLLAGVLFLAACTTTQGVANQIYSVYGGRDVDQFFRVYGPPASQYSFANGDKFYTWNSGMQSVTLPGSANYQGTVYPQGQVYGSATYDPPQTVPIFCEVRFLVDPNGIVKRVDITRDTLGWWQLSRCAEILHE